MCSVMNNRSSKIRLPTKGSSSSHHKTTSSSTDTSKVISDNGNISWTKKFYTIMMVKISKLLLIARVSR